MRDRAPTLLDEVLIRGLSDIIQLREVVAVAQLDFEIPEGTKLVDAVSDCFREMVDEHLCVVGDLDDGEAPLKIVPWNGIGDEVAARITDEWNSLGRKPSMNEICWLELTEIGRRRALLQLSMLEN